jgi:monoamine oxidase
LIDDGRSAVVAIVGAASCGLSAAIHLRLAGYEVALYEANERVGVVPG